MCVQLENSFPENSCVIKTSQLGHIQDQILKIRLLSGSFLPTYVCSDELLWLTIPPFTGVPRDLGWKVPRRECFLGDFGHLARSAPKECFMSAFWHFWSPKTLPQSTRKALFGALRARCPKSPKKGAFQPGLLGTPVNGGRDRNLWLSTWLFF